MAQSSDTRRGDTTEAGRKAGTAVTLVLLLAAAGPTAGQEGPTQRPLGVREVVEFESLALRSPVRVSPDGRRVAYTAAGAQRPLGSVLELVRDTSRATAGVRVADLETGEVTDLTPGSGSWGPAWSPDGSTLAFYSTRAGTPRLWTWTAEGGARQVTAAPVWPAFMDQTPRWADGRRVVVKLLPEERSVRQAARSAVPAAPDLPGRKGTSVQLIRSRDPDVGADALPEWIRWAYAGDLAAVDVGSGTVRRLAPDRLAMWWDVSPDGSTLAFSAIAGIQDERAGFNVYSVSLSGGPVSTLPGRLVRPFGDGISWSPAGDRLAYVSDGGVYVVHPGRQNRTRVADARPGWAEDAGPIWMPDGRGLVFTDGALWRVPLDGGQPERMAAFDGRRIHAVVTGAARVPVRTDRGGLAGPAE